MSDTNPIMKAIEDGKLEVRFGKALDPEQDGDLYDEASLTIRSQYDRFDLHGEAWREYIYLSGVGIRIDDPVALYLPKASRGERSSGGHSHRVTTATQGIYIAPGWLAIRWEPRDGAPLLQL